MSFSLHACSYLCVLDVPYAIVGGTDQEEEEEGSFVWVNSNNAVAFPEWKAGEPNNKGEEDCVWLYRDGRYLNDVPCDTDRDFVCELNQ